MADKFTAPKGATKGPEPTKSLVNNHRDCLKELQDTLGNVQDELDGMGEDTAFLSIKDAQIVSYTVRAILTDTDIP